MLGADLLSLAAHKLHGPRGVAVLFVRRGLQLAPLVPGHQERGRRGGTENVAAAVGMAKACSLAQASLAEMPKVAALRDLLEERVLAAVPRVVRNGAGPRVPNTTNLRFDGADGETLLIGLDLAGISASSGSACSSGAQSPSHVLRAMGLSAEEAQASLRFSLSRETTSADVERLLQALPGLVEESRRARSAPKSPRTTAAMASGVPMRSSKCGRSASAKAVADA
ncbi:MAG: cysteine desulfurase family protein [Myxococcales bacterium]